VRGGNNAKGPYQRSILRTKFMIGGKFGTLVVDGGSTSNIVSNEVI
jgi:hypothetical protein